MVDNLAVRPGPRQYPLNTIQKSANFEINFNILNHQHEYVMNLLAHIFNVSMIENWNVERYVHVQVICSIQ